jgi:hypothetical protein
MQHSIKTVLDVNCIFDTQHIAETSTMNVHRLISNNKVHLFLPADSSNNSPSKSYYYDGSVKKLLANLANGNKPINYETLQITSSASLLLANHSLYVSSYKIETLYSNAWSNAIEIFVMYGQLKIVLSSIVVNLLNFKLAPIDLEYANRYYSTYANIKIIDVHTLANSTSTASRQLFADLVGIDVSEVNPALLSSIMYDFKYIDESSLDVNPDTGLLSFETTDISVTPISPSAYSLSGDIVMLCDIVDDHALSISFDESNTDLIQTLTQINASLELLDISHVVSVDSYKTTIDESTFEYNGVDYVKLNTYNIALRNPQEPAEAVIFKPIINEDSELIIVSINTLISSSANTISISKQSQFIFTGLELAKLKHNVISINATDLHITNKLVQNKNVVNVQTGDTSIIAQKQTIIFAPLTAVHVYINESDSTITGDNANSIVSLKQIAMTYAIKFVSDVAFDLRNYESIYVIYGSSKIQPSKVTDDTIYVMLSWQDYSEIAIEINGIVSTVLTAMQA